MSTPDVNTDQRLLALMGSGKRFFAAIDPKNLLPGLEPTQLLLDFSRKAWSLTLVSDNGEELQISGTIEEKVFFINRFSFPNTRTGRDFESLPAKTVTEALGDLSRVPARLKRFLSKQGPQKGRNEANYDGNIPFMKTAKEALFFNVEDTGPVSSKPLFKKWCIRYVLSEEGDVTSIIIEARYKTQTSTITVSTEADIYGLGNKKVTLLKSLGEERTAVVNCLAKKDMRTIPSILVAMDLDKIIPPMYFPEIKEVKGKGVPKKK